MAKKELYVDNVLNCAVSGAFIRCFQEHTLLLLKNRGKLTELQYGIALKVLGER